ncbi:hypothetical protein GJU39_17080 [Pedobacter petrophilus]|uniref:Uncharacterized protein n=1 Tax=Pedobacter petrophilus TaxID=1908241 RepID=A0A7K0G328_9SPHI|nr:hypothetical protein [Pedobacter petrophilus]MRX77800.1 hypothetical protein [Pedobacter petrophilus]
MKTSNYIYVVALVCLGSCNQAPEKKNGENKPHDTLASTSVSETISSVDNNLDNVPVSDKELGQFPYLKAPEGYKFSGDTNRQLEEKYFFHSDSLVQKVSGKYFHTTIFPSGTSFEDTFIVKQYTKDIEELGGVQIYAGGLPNAARELIDKEKPAYAEDMYDPMPYKYKQFLINTKKEKIWIELCHGLNSNQIDLTVMLKKKI